MTLFRRLSAAVAALILCLSLSVSALADDNADEVQEQTAGDTEQTAETTESAAKENEKMTFGGKSWDDIVAEVLAKYNVSSDSVSIGYLNLVTGEEHYLNGDLFRVAGSMYKLPLNMYFARLIASGELDWDAKYPNATFEYVRDESLIQSNNDWSSFLFNQLGGYNAFRDLTAEFMGREPGEDEQYYFENMYTAEQFISCLKLLYNEPDSFPDIIETMQKADTERFFMYTEPRFHIAHKYGYYSENGHSAMNDCGICFTSQPIAIVMFTDNVQNSEELLSGFCTAMCEYTEYQASLPEPTPEPDPTPAPTPTPVPATPEPEEIVPEKKTVSGIIPLFFIVVFTAAALIVSISFAAKHKAKAFWLILSALVAALAMLLALIGNTSGTIYAKPDGDPRETVTEFFDDIVGGDYDAANKLLRDYADLGLSTPPSSDAAKAAYDALHASYGYELTGECSQDRLDAVQKVTFCYLDLTAFNDVVKLETEKQLEKLVQSRPKAELYDANNNYLPEVTDEAYLLALNKVLESADAYRTSTELELSLAYSGGRWQIITSPALLKALNGGTAN